MPDAFVARQPIFDDRLDVVAYELLFRGGYVDDAPSADRERATATVILNSLTELDLERIVAGKDAWVDVTRDFLVGGLAEAIPPGTVGLEVPETELADPAVAVALRALSDRGYPLALDDYQGRPGSGEVLDVFDLVKLDLRALGRDRLREHALRLSGGRARVVAENVATQADHAFCAKAGCDLFQGYFFCRPAVVCTRGIAANRLALLEVVGALAGSDVELTDVEPLIARDVALSFRLLRYVNSAYFGLRGDVRSIGQALALLGTDNLRRWASLSVLASIDDKPPELTVTALIRARFCELAGETLGIARPGELFTLGLFSVIDAMLDAPMADIVESLPFAADMREALVQRRGQLGRLLEYVVALEAGDEKLAAAELPRAGVLYVEALMWATGEGDALLSGTPVAEPASDHSQASDRPGPAGLLPASDPKRAQASVAPPGESSGGPAALAPASTPVTGEARHGARVHRSPLRRAWDRCRSLWRRQPA